MISKRILAAVVLIGVAMASQPALAGTIRATYSSSANFGSGPVGYYNGSVVPNPNSSTSLVGVGIGGDRFTSSNHTYDFSATGQFNTWCVDIYHWLTGGEVTYTVADGTALATEMNILRPAGVSGLTRVNDLIQLADERYGSLITETDSAAFQLAVWAITYGTADGAGNFHITPYANTSTNNPSIAGFMVDSPTASSAYGVLANTWLASLSTAARPGNYSLTYLSDGTPITPNGPTENTQDMVVFTPVPEPATLGLLAIALLGLGFAIRKKV